MGEGCTRAGQIINRVVSERLLLQAGRGVSTPGIDDQDEHEGDALEALGPLEVTSFTGMAARCNYLSVDRPDFMFPVKALCRQMSKPTVRSMRRLKRVGRYLKFHPRLVRNFQCKPRLRRLTCIQMQIGQAARHLENPHQAGRSCEECIL